MANPIQSNPIQSNPSLDRIYINFIQNLCESCGNADMAKPLIEGFGAYRNAATQKQPLVEGFDASLWNGDFSTFLAAPVSVYLTYKLYKSVIMSIINILGGKTETNNLNQIIARVESNRDQYREELIQELSELTDKDINSLNEHEIVELLTKMLEKCGEMFNGIPLLKDKIVGLKKGVDPNKGAYPLNELDIRHGGNTYEFDNPNANAVRVYENRAYDALRTIPAMLIGLFSGIILKNDARVEFYVNSLKKLMTWSGTWRRKFDDICNTWKNVWRQTNKYTQHPSKHAVNWLNQHSDEKHSEDEWNTILPERNTPVADAIGMSRTNYWK